MYPIIFFYINQMYTIQCSRGYISRISIFNIYYIEYLYLSQHCMCIVYYTYAFYTEYMRCPKNKRVLYSTKVYKYYYKPIYFIYSLSLFIFINSWISASKAYKGLTFSYHHLYINHNIIIYLMFYSVVSCTST